MFWHPFLKGLFQWLIYSTWTNGSRVWDGMVGGDAKADWCNSQSRKWWNLKLGQMVKNLPIMPETQVWSLSWEDPLEKEMVIHSNILAWEIPWTGNLVGCSPWGSRRVGHNWETNTDGYGKEGMIRKYCLSESYSFCSGEFTGEVKWFWEASSASPSELFPKLLFSPAGPLIYSLLSPVCSEAFLSSV